ncbi:MAG: insulinase family protein [Bacteroidales bacterium]|nr:insulinase family protein [Bacteroidales bacterium]
MKVPGSLIRLLLLAAIALTAAACSRSTQKDSLSISYEKYVMPNGLQVILHQDHSDPVISYAIMYHVGSSREVPGRTGFAHLFEHLLFTGSENVPTGAFDRILEAAGGSNNGFTSRDVTTYFDVFPKNALEKVLWLESDRMGFFINSVTQRSLAIQQNVVQNEKRQYQDNSPYGFTDYVISKNLYPEDHPYNWEVIGEMEDLRNASLDDVRKYYDTFYGPNNATLVIGGDFDADTVKALLDKYFGEIKAHGEVAARAAMNVTLDTEKRLFHEDNFANVPELTMVWPVAENYSVDSYPLMFLASLLSEGKKAPMYKVLVKEKQLTPNVSVYGNLQELAGEFTLSVTANAGKSLREIEEAVREGFERFETEGFTERDVERIKAMMERSFYQELNSVLNKSIQLAYYNTYLNDPGYIVKDIEKIKAVTPADIMRVYEKYIKGRPGVVTSFVPKGMTGMMAENSVKAAVSEEDITKASQVAIDDIPAGTVEKTPSAIDRSVEPPSGPEPGVKVPEVWRATLANGMEVMGIRNSELPLVSMNLVISGGALLDRVGLPGVASMVAAVLPQGTRNKTPEELEEEIKLLGSVISMRAGFEEITINASSLSRNFDKTVALLKEILLEPRWDSTEFAMAQTRTRNRLLQAEARPASVASGKFYRLVYGPDNILGYDLAGTKESVDRITPEDLMAFYEKNFSPSVSKILVAGNVTKEEVLEALKPLEAEWMAKEVEIKGFQAPAIPDKSQVFFVDIPGSRQSVFYCGYPALTRDNPDYVKADFANYRMGGAFTSILNQILREEKGFTYGASSSFREMKNTAPFVISTMVRSDATRETMEIITGELRKYREGISEDELQFIKNCMIRSNALRFETNEALTSMLSYIGKYGFSDDWVRKEEDVIRNMTVEDHKAVTQKYFDPDRMYYVVVGDAATQMKQLEKSGFGKPVPVAR